MLEAQVCAVGALCAGVVGHSRGPLVSLAEPGISGGSEEEGLVLEAQVCAVGALCAGVVGHSRGPLVSLAEPGISGGSEEEGLVLEAQVCAVGALCAGVVGHSRGPLVSLAEPGISGGSEEEGLVREGRWCARLGAPHAHSSRSRHTCHGRARVAAATALHLSCRTLTTMPPPSSVPGQVEEAEELAAIRAKSVAQERQAAAAAAEVRALLRAPCRATRSPRPASRRPLRPRFCGPDAGRRAQGFSAPWAFCLLSPFGRCGGAGGSGGLFPR